VNYKTCKILNDKFKLDEKYNVFLNIDKKVEVTDGLEEGYIYAAMFFYDEVDKEIKKLVTIVREKSEAIKLDSPDLDISMLVLELSRRVKDVIGDDSLDALIKEVVGENEPVKSISLTPETAEIQKYGAVKEGILSESIQILFDTIIKNTDHLCKECGNEMRYDPKTGMYKCKNCGNTIKEEKGPKRVELSQNYVRTMTTRQKKLLGPALKMVGFLNQIRLDDFELDSGAENERYVVSFSPYALSTPFAVQEEAIKRSIKDFMAKNMAVETEKVSDAEKAGKN